MLLSQSEFYLYLPGSLSRVQNFVTEAKPYKVFLLQATLRVVSVSGLSAWGYNQV
jgi:hypothetical protein